MSTWPGSTRLCGETASGPCGIRPHSCPDLEPCHRHGLGALPGPAVPALPRHLHLRQEERHPLRAAHRGPAQRVAPSSLRPQKVGAWTLGREWTEALPPASLDCLSGQHFSDDFAQVNPLRKVPALKDGDFTLAESVAILLYLSRKYEAPDHWYPQDLQTRARVDEYLSWQHTDLQTSCIRTMWQKMLLPVFLGQPVPPETLASTLAKLDRCLQLLEDKFLKDQDFLAGPHISMADLVAITELMHGLKEFPVAQRVKDLALSLQWLGLLLWRGFDPWPGNFHMLRRQQKKPVSAGCDLFKSRPKLAAWRQRVEAEVGEDLFQEAHAAIMKAKDLPPADKAIKEKLKPLVQPLLH
uniref:glutathione transferase n=1 Tax=Sus scrofa TaxID=9823 RepID=A0A8D1VGH1_PIG